MARRPSAPRIVGRRQELGRLLRVGRPRGPRAILLFGPGGVGKSSLCRALASKLAAQATVTHLDAHDFDHTPSALTEAIGLPRLKRSRRRHVLVIDTYEELADLDPWIRDHLLAELPANVALVLSGRRAPSAAWRVLAAGDRRVELLALSNLPDADCRKLLRARGVAPQHDATILAFTRGHPLALCLAADAQREKPDTPFSPTSSPEVVRVLLQQLLRDVPSARHRAGVEASCLARVTSESLLAHLMGESDVHDIYEWLAGLSFMELASDGIFPHDLAREVIARELRWRDRDRFAELFRLASNYYRVQIEKAHNFTATSDWMFLFHHHPAFGDTVALSKHAGLYTDTARTADIPRLLELVERFEGRESRDLAARWFATPAAAIRVLRDGDEPIGLLVILSLTNDTPRELIDGDPATRIAWPLLHLRAGETATFYRWHMTHDTYQRMSTHHSILLVRAIYHDLTVPDQAIGLMVFADFDAWRDALAHSGAVLLEEAAFTVGGHRYDIVVKDWRRMPASALYFEHMLKLVRGAEPDVPAPEIVALSHDGFAAAVHAALRDLDRQRALSDNALLYSRFVSSQVGNRAPIDTRVATLRAAIRTAADALAASRRTSKFHEALVTTYLSGETTQEAAAERIGVPFTTYRYRLAQAIDRVVDSLWRQEFG